MSKMYNYPIEKYRFYQGKTKTTGAPCVIAVSTYEGKTVRGVAACDPKDTFDFEKGKKLAAGRCALKIAEKRRKRAARELDKAIAANYASMQRVNAMNDYFNDARIAERDAKMDLEGLLRTM